MSAPGGADAPGNVVGACRWCNGSKGHKDAQWIDERHPEFWAWFGPSSTVVNA